MSVNTLIVQTEGTSYNSETDYGVVVLEGDSVQKEVQNITTQVWYGENGEEAYIPSSGVTYKAYDYAFTLGVKSSGSDSARTRMGNFINDIKGKTCIFVKQPYIDVTLLNAYLSKVEDDEIGEDFITFKVTFHVTNP